MTWRVIFFAKGSPFPDWRDGFATEAEADAWADRHGLDDADVVEVGA